MWCAEILHFIYIGKFLSDRSAETRLQNPADLNKEMKGHLVSAPAVFVYHFNTLSWSKNMCHLIFEIICSVLGKKRRQIWEQNESAEGPPEATVHIFHYTH